METPGPKQKCLGDLLVSSWAKPSWQVAGSNPQLYKSVVKDITVHVVLRKQPLNKCFLDAGTTMFYLFRFGDHHMHIEERRRHFWP